MKDDLYWSPVKLATLVEQVPASDDSLDANVWSRFDFHLFLDDQCRHGVPLSYSARMVGSWPVAYGTAPPLAIAQRLFDTMCAYQIAHSEAVGGPDDEMILSIRKHDAFWHLALT